VRGKQVLTMASTRRLAAILAADLYGYSRLMDEDEEGTIRRLRQVQAQLLYPKFAQHGGRLVKTTGDGFLVEFTSVIQALRCASEIQAGMVSENAVPAERRLMFRIGIHQGDIVVEDNDIFGNGVNIAARLESIADPGGICISGRVQEDAVGRIDLDFEDIGEQELKNISRPVRVFRVRGGTVAPVSHGEAAADYADYADDEAEDERRPSPTAVAPAAFVTAKDAAAQDPSSAEAIDAGLEDKIEIVELSGAWIALERERRTALPVSGRNPGTRNQLGVDATLGTRAWDSRPRVMLRVGPLDRAGFAELLPDRPGLQNLVSRAQARLGTATEIIVNPVLAGTEVSPLHLDTETAIAPRLGWNTWLRAPECSAANAAADRADAVFAAQPARAPEARPAIATPVGAAQ
jgi:class 3 adenylate cyclase